MKRTRLHPAWLIALGGAATLLGLLAGVQRWLAPELRALEAAHIRVEFDEARQRIERALQTRLAGLARSCGDWAAWDSMHRFVQTRGPAEFEQDNFGPEALRTLGLSRVVVVAHDGRVVVQRDYDLAADKPTTFDHAWNAPTPELRAELPRELAGFVQGPDGQPSLLAARPILRTDRTGAPAGLVLMVAPLRSDDLADVSAATGCSVQIDPVDAPSAARSAQAESPGWDSLTLPAAGGGAALRLRYGLSTNDSHAYFERLRSLLALAGLYVLLAAAAYFLYCLMIFNRGGVLAATAQPAAKRAPACLALVATALVGAGLTWPAYQLAKTWAGRQLTTEESHGNSQLRAAVEQALSVRLSSARWLAAIAQRQTAPARAELATLAALAREYAADIEQIVWIRPAPRSAGSAAPTSQPTTLTLEEVLAAAGRSDSAAHDGADALSEDEAYAIGLLRDYAWEPLAPESSAAAPAHAAPSEHTDWRVRLAAVTEKQQALWALLPWESSSTSSAALTLLQPVYEPSADLSTPAAREAALRGVLALRIAPERLIADTSTALRLDHRPATLSFDEAPSPLDDERSAALAEGAIRLQAGGAGFALRVERGPRLGDPALRDLPKAVIAIGVLLTLVALAYLRTLQQRQRFAESLVEQRTRELGAALLTQTKLSQEISAANQRAQAANEAKSAFLAHMSHELRTPMNAILGFSEQLQEGQLPPAERDEALTVIRQNGAHLLELINDLLDYTKIEADKMTVEEVECDPVALCLDVLRTLLDRARRKGLELRLFVRGENPPPILSDPTRLRQIMINLVGNAVKFTETGGIRLLLSQTPGRGAAPPHLAIDVIDSGIGMAPEVLSRLFSPFAQADASMSRRFGGTGLGLAISRRLARLLGGDITVTSTLGKGSTFHLHVGIGRPAPPGWGEAPAPAVGPHGLREVPLRGLMPTGGDSPMPYAARAEAPRALLEREPTAGATAPAQSAAVSPSANDPAAPTLESTPVAAPAPPPGMEKETERMAAGSAFVPAAAPPPAGLARPPENAAPLPLAGRIILLAEDGPDNQRLLSVILRKAGATVDLADDGQYAYDAVLAREAGGGAYDIIIMDMQMPRMDGYDATRALRARGYRGLIVALTAHAMTGERERCLEAGCDEYATKPIDRKALLTLLQRLLNAPATAALG